MDKFGRSNTKEECIKDLELVIKGLQHNLKLLKEGFRPCNTEWVACAEPFNNCITYLANSHEELIDMDLVRKEETV